VLGKLYCVTVHGKLILQCLQVLWVCDNLCSTREPFGADWSTGAAVAECVDPVLREEVWYGMVGVGRLSVCLTCFRIMCRCRTALCCMCYRQWGARDRHRWVHGRTLRVSAVCCVLCAVCCVLCAVCCVPCAVCRVPCAVCRVPCAVCRVPCAVCRVPCSVFRVPCSVFRVPCSVFRVPCSVFRVPCAVCCVLCAVCCM